ncbi:hypothetical protein AGABI1DRAFT_115352 [Agaricus bisporus var. burnettii JB137-S8]|uniref:FAD-binding PCMH-type domain-containing protein n=1 Tax=Agaricus bisporus var. burnettii (strain JB137-S8 / ATCC MYA-4627 / FGSC 10392) TaxID=597362 RepID=K5X1X7_AGABU|nr:uncharacterized protein AGABI1DRAFT_115352 [Agaricus bisporus var. burnettii JB137-S8]EKM77123.1 hypothetical protein AGABI1DRAFT_115352 [Agaricus bisporus var. burnettii JB137-S8]
MSITSLGLSIYLLLLSTCFLICGAQNLVADLKSQGIELVAPGDQGYNSASAAFNRRFVFKPAVVTFPTTPAQVSSIVKTAIKYKKHVAARGGGHSYVANGLGGQNGAVVIDMNRHFTRIQVNNQANTAKIDSGSRLGDIALTLNNHGRGFGHGTCPYVGIGGHSLFGGFAYASRLWGMVVDVIESIDLVLANGTITTASKNKNSELFWGMRGAGPSFGITTSMTIKTFAVPPSATVFQYTWDLNATSAASFLNAYQTFSLGQVPPQFGSELVLSKGSRQGRVSITLQGVWYDAANKFDAIIRPLVMKVSQKPRIQMVKAGKYIDSVAFFGESNNRLNTTNAPDTFDTFYVKSLLTPESQPMTTKSSQAFMQYLANQGFQSQSAWFIEVEEFGGPGSLVNAVPLDSTSFGNRGALFLMQFYVYESNPNNPFAQSGFSLADGMVNSVTSNNPSNWPYTAYPNYLDNRLQNWQQLYYGQHYPRLQRLKGSVDPGNVFQFPTSIEKP